MGTQLRKIIPDDFEAVYPVLKHFNHPRLGKDDWQRLFISYWDRTEDYVGYGLFDGERVVGFLGLIFSERVINQHRYKFCNLTSWIVEENHRNQSLSLLFPVLRLKDYTFTDFTASTNLIPLLTKLKFEILETHLVKIRPIPDFQILNTSCFIELDRQRMQNYLDAENLKIYEDHVHFNCIYVLIRAKEGNCFLILKTLGERRVSFLRILVHWGYVHYISHRDIFFRYINILTPKICLQLGLVGLLVENRFCDGYSIKHGVSMEIRQSKLFKSSLLKRSDIDTLYSEIFILDH